ncbi:methylated-DNA--[protein]-cysteine S-methyltransferase [Candidatus Bathyarchaeota archaeon]|nr:methylated-DNA--[protein]-cysteine S-methyltransferase [Candidatus Bathyarchaeota archaeon]
MIHIYCSEVNEIWFAAAVDAELKVWASSFAHNHALVIQRILAHLPIGLEFTSERDMKNEEFAKKVLQALSTLFRGQPFEEKFNLVLDFLPQFTKLVLTVTSAIPRGYVTTYSEIANVLGKSKGARAVGNAEAANPLPLLIPCHRVIRSNGEIGGYGYGTAIKREILIREAEATAQKLEPKIIDIKGKPLHLTPTLTILEQTSQQF